MAAIRETVFTDTQLRELIAHGYACAAAALAHNKQTHYESYERLATALQQVVTECSLLRKETTHAGRPESQEGSDAGGAESPDQPKRKRVQR